jgi:hypothetical protein
MTDDELERIWKEAVITYLGYYPSNYLEGLRKIMKHLSGRLVSQSKFEESTSQI